MEHRRLAVVLSHLYPTSDPGRPFPHHQRPGFAETPVLSTSRCHGETEGESKGESGEKKPCVFCMIIRGESPAFKLYEDDTCLCILDSSPLSCGHSLIIPKSHYPSLEATPPHVVAAMCSKVPLLSNAIMRATQSDSFNLLVNSGSAAGQVIYHTHFHIIPRRAGDHLWPSESSRRKPIKCNQETVNLVGCIQQQLSSLNNQTCNALESMIPKKS